MSITLEPRVDATPIVDLIAPDLSSSPLSSAPSSQLWSSQATIEPASLATSSQGSPSTSGDLTPSSPSSNADAIIGSVIGGLAVLGITAIAALYLLLRHRRRKAEAPILEEKDIEEPPSHISTIKQGGWGPSELPTYHSPRTPVELPAETASNHNFRCAGI
ncbi:hypothetical protein F4820DRAFT_421907 [Hypoxylon rubiginosum]|uniref:Uncharacterized protein n=1 Tax=Hypoxylon rubiginosum TaxID=110542 RepID=A0ACB9Z1F2_9PEZI|nr:hypothetical protein F4820DRAFT_421907 [Hypoxylon rubiginosum]